jgi:hypothetical protein
VRLEGLGKLKKKNKKKNNDLIGNRTRILPACSIVPQPTTLPCSTEQTQMREGERENENGASPRPARKMGSPED